MLYIRPYKNDGEVENFSVQTSKEQTELSYLKYHPNIPNAFCMVGWTVKSSEIDPGSYQEKIWRAEPNKVNTGTAWYI